MDHGGDTHLQGPNRGKNISKAHLHNHAEPGMQQAKAWTHGRIWAPGDATAANAALAGGAVLQDPALTRAADTFPSPPFLAGKERKSNDQATE